MVHMVHSTEGSAKIIKISEKAVREIVMEFITENQDLLFLTNDTISGMAELSFSFFNNGDLVCYQYDRDKGILDICEHSLKQIEYTTQSLFSSDDKKFKMVKIRNGKIQL